MIDRIYNFESHTHNNNKIFLCAIKTVIVAKNNKKNFIINGGYVRFI